LWGSGMSGKMFFGGFFQWDFRGKMQRKYRGLSEGNCPGWECLGERYVGQSD